MDVLALQDLGYSDKAIRLLADNVNHRDLEDSNYTLSTESDCGDILILYLKVRRQVIENITFQYIGCSGLQVAASALTELAMGKSFNEALKIDPDRILNYLQSIPAGKEECVLFASKSLWLAIEKMQTGDTKLSLYPSRIQTSDW
jgi:nitrogen fixation NifU-like protein